MYQEGYELLECEMEDEEIQDQCPHFASGLCCRNTLYDDCLYEDD